MGRLVFLPVFVEEVYDLKALVFVVADQDLHRIASTCIQHFLKSV